MVNDQPECECPKDSEGEFCEHYRCSNYCKNRGTCYVDAHFNAANDSIKPPLLCKCPLAWTGDRCEVPVANCSSPCYNGVCTVKFGTEMCICLAGFKGSKCQHCDELQCENDGICRKDQLDNAKCECTKDFKGIRCENSPCEGMTLLFESFSPLKIHHSTLTFALISIQVSVADMDSVHCIRAVLNVIVIKTTGVDNVNRKNAQIIVRMVEHAQ